MVEDYNGILFEDVGISYTSLLLDMGLAIDLLLHMILAFKLLFTHGPLPLIRHSSTHGP